MGEVRHASGPGPFEAGIVSHRMAARQHDAVGRKFTNASLGAVQFGSQGHLLHRGDRMKALHEGGVGVLQIGGILRTGHFAVEERTFQVDAQAG